MIHRLFLRPPLALGNLSVFRNLFPLLGFGAFVASSELAYSGGIPLAPEIAIFGGADDQAPPLADGQAALVDFGCTKPNVPLVRKFTVKNVGDEVLVLPALGLDLPPGYTLNPPWPTAFITPRVDVIVFKEDAGATGDEDSIRLNLVTMPSVISVLDISIITPIDPPGGGAPPQNNQLPYIDKGEDILISQTLTTLLDPSPVDPMIPTWQCPMPGVQSNPNGDICTEFSDPIFPDPNNQQQADRMRKGIVRFTEEVLTGTLDDPLSNGEARFGLTIGNLNPPYAASTQNDGDGYGQAGVEVSITLFNSVTGLPDNSPTLTGKFVDDNIENDQSQVTLTGAPVEVPIPIPLAPGQSFTFCVELNSADEGTYAGPWSLENNDADENPFDFQITGIVDGTPPMITNLPMDLTVPSGANCLAMVTWTAPGVMDALDPNPTIMQTFGPMSGDDFPAGMTAVEYTARDCAGNETIETFIVTVQDQNPPSLVGTLPKQIIASAAPGADFAIVEFPTLGAIDDCDDDPVVTCDPASGYMFPLGKTIVTCTAMDASGNESDPATIEVIVIQAQPSPSPRALDVVVLRNEDAPDIAGAKIQNINHAFLNNVGNLTLETSLTGAGLNNIAIFSESGGSLSLVAQKGDLAPVSMAPILSFDDLVINDNGDTSFRVRESRKAHLTTVGGPVGLAVREGDTPPATAAQFSILYKTAFNDLGHTYNPANLAIGIDGVTTASDTGIWTKPAGLALVQIAREGDSVGPTLPGALFGQVSPRLAVNASGRVVFYAFLKPGSGGVTVANNTAIFAGVPPMLTIVAREGTVTPGPDDPALLSVFGAESINAVGDVAFEAFLATGGGGSPVTTLNNSGIYANIGGTLRLVAREGDLAPCVAGPAGDFADFRDIFIADNGDVFFKAFLRGPSVDSESDGSLWRWDASDGTLHPVVREGDLAPGTEGGVFRLIIEFAVNSIGSVVHVSTLDPLAGATTTANNLGLWLDSGNDGFPIVRLREGDTLDFGGDDIRTIAGMSIDSMTNLSGGSGGFGMVINDNNEVAVKVVTNFNSVGAFVLTPPPPAPPALRQAASEEASIDAEQPTVGADTIGQRIAPRQLRSERAGNLRRRPQSPRE